MKNKKIVPIFYAADKFYMPFLAVALTSLKETKTAEYDYHVHILYTGELNDRAEKIKAMEEEDFSVSFVNVSKQAEEISSLMHCRDYYTSAIYFRLFIPDLFPQYDKGIYLDCDTVAIEDIGKLFDIDIKDNYIGAVADQAVASVPAFCDYTKNALGIAPETYFNSGVIVMNLKRFREMDFYNVFCKVLGSYEFIVAPDQDCLNLICKGKVYYYGAEWNAMPIAGGKEVKPALVHYNLTMKPWHYSGVLYEEYFWDYARRTPFYDSIVAIKAAFTPEMAQRDETGGARLIALAQAEADSPCNYLHSIVEKGKQPMKKRKNEVGRYGFIEDFARKTRGLKAD